MKHLYKYLLRIAHFFKEIKKYLSSNNKYIIVSFWMTLFIYFRFLRNQLPYEFLDLKNMLTQRYFILQIGFIMLHVILILYTIKTLIFPLKKSYAIFLYFQKIITRVITLPFQETLNTIAPKIPYSGLFFCFFANFIEKRGLGITKIFVILFSILPRIIVCLVFIVETLYYHRIDCFISSLPLLVIPLIWFIFIELFTTFGKQALLDIPKYIKVIPKGKVLPNGWYPKYQFEPRPEYKYDKTVVREYGELYFLSMKIWGYGENYFKQFQQQLMPYCTIFTSTLYIIGTGYKLFFIFL